MGSEIAFESRAGPTRGVAGRWEPEPASRADLDAREAAHRRSEVRSRAATGRIGHPSGGPLLGATLALLLGVAAPGAAPGSEAAAMIEAVREAASDTQAVTGRATLDERVLEAMARLPRHEFVPERLRDRAYENRPLPIGHGQTISQPYIVALMTDLLEVEPGQRLLEVGTGSAYQAALLAELGAEVFTIEIVGPLATSARSRLQRLGFVDVQVRLGDGYHGWPEAAPFDGILVTAAASHVPPPLVAQLAPGGVMVIPVGDRFNVQHLLRVRKDDDGALEVRQILPVRFVPLTGGH